MEVAMMEAGRRVGGGTVLKCAALALVLWSSSGCYLTMKAWQVANRPVHRSRAVGALKSSPEGDTIVFDLERCPDHEDGYYSCRIPSAWQCEPVKASPWGSDIVELADIDRPSMTPCARPAWRGTRRLLTMRFDEVVAAKAPPRWFDSQRDVGVVYDWSTDRFAANIFGYDPIDRRWVRLSEVPIDTPGVREGMVAFAAFVTPLTATVDALCWCAAPYIVVGAAMGGGNIDLPEPPEQPREVKARMLISKLAMDRPGRKLIDDIAKLRGCGALAKPAVPRLKALLRHSTGTVRIAAADALRALCPQDSDFFMPTVVDMLRNGNPEERCHAALVLRGIEPEEAVARLAEALGDAHPSVRLAATFAIGFFSNQDAVDCLTDMLTDTDPQVRLVAVRSLGAMGVVAQNAAPYLQAARSDASFRIRREAKRSLVAVTRGSSQRARTTAMRKNLDVVEDRVRTIR
jgi:hypothetical protein